MLILVWLSLTGWHGIAGRTILDLTHTLDENVPQWPLEEFGIFNLTFYNLKTLYAKSDAEGTWLAFWKVELFEHMGTHIDAPVHYGYGRQATHEIPPDRLVGPGVMIDVREKAKRNANYALTVDDILEYESKYGRIPPNAIVMLNSGWAEKYHDPKLVFGTSNVTDSSSFNFPGYSFEACKMLLQDRQVSVVGSDTPSTDPGNDITYTCHRYLQPNNVPLLEYVANLDSMPPAGSTVALGAPKHRGGTGGQTRILAIIDDEDGTSGTVKAVASGTWMLYLAVLVKVLNY